MGCFGFWFFFKNQHRLIPGFRVGSVLVTFLLRFQNLKHQWEKWNKARGRPRWRWLGGNGQKIQKNRWLEPSHRRQKGRPNKGQWTRSPHEPKKRREVVLLMVGSYLTHNPSNVACIQIVRFKSNRRSRINISCQNNLPFYNKG